MLQEGKKQFRFVVFVFLGLLLFFLLQFGGFLNQKKSQFSSSVSSGDTKRASNAGRKKSSYRKKTVTSSSRSSHNFVSTKESEHQQASSYLFQEGDFSLFYKDLEEKEREHQEDPVKAFPESLYSLDDQLSLQLLLEQKELEQDKAQKQAFIDAFLKNALKKGYKIELNDKLEVVSIQKIEKPKVVFPSGF